MNADPCDRLCSAHAYWHMQHVIDTDHDHAACVELRNLRLTYSSASTSRLGRTAFQPILKRIVQHECVLILLMIPHEMS